MPRHRTSALCAALVALTVVAYLPVWKNDFVDFDDELYITANPQVVQGVTWAGTGWAWTNSHAKYWQPMTWLSLQLDAELFSTVSDDGQHVLSPAAFHGQNLFWHTGSVLLLFALLRRLTAAVGRSFLVAALFAVHPMHVESVAWAAERKDVLSVFFGLLTLWQYARYVERPGWGRYLGVAAAFAVSLLSKPMLVTLPFVLLLLDYWPLRRLASGRSAPGAATEGDTAPASLGRLVLEKVPLFALAAAVGAVTLILREQNGAALSLEVLPLSARFGNAAAAYGWYVWRTFWPSGLAVFYPHPFANWSVAAALAGAGLVIGMTALTLWQAKRRRWLVVGWLWFVGALVPVIGLAQGGEQAYADRFSYWPHIGLFLAAVWGLAELVGRLGLAAPVRRAACGLVLAGLGVLTWLQAGYWRDTGALWERALAATEDNHRAHLNLGAFHLKRGRPDAASGQLAVAVSLCPDHAEYRYSYGVALLALGKLKEAAVEFQETLRRVGDHTDAWHNLGTTRLRQGNAEAAARCFRKALERQPAAADALAGLGTACWRGGKRRDAVRAFEAALEKNPREPEAWHGLGVAELARGRPVKAAELLATAVRLEPQRPKAQSDLGLALTRQGKWAEAMPHYLAAVRLQEQTETFLERMNGDVRAPQVVSAGVLIRCRLGGALRELGYRAAAARAYREALERDPHWPEAFAAQAWVLATADDPAGRDPQLAAELATQAVQGVGEPTASLLDALAAAQASRGQFQEAAQTAQQALAKASASGEKNLVQAIRHRLQRYTRGETVTVQGSAADVLHPYRY